MPAHAQDDAAPDPEVRLVVSSLTGVVGSALVPEGEEVPDDVDDLRLRVLIENEGEVDVADLQVVVEVHGSVNGARSLLSQALDDQVVDTGRLVVERADVRDGGELLVGDIAGEALRVGGDQIGWRSADDVYPVEISVLYGTEVLDRVVTAVVHLQDRERLARPLQTTVVWPVSAPTTRTAAGRYPAAVPDALAPGGRVDVLLSALERHPGAPVLLAPEAELVEELADRANGFTLVDGTRVASDDPPAAAADRLLQRLRALAESSPLPLVVGPYARADVSALASAPAGIREMARTAIESARTRTQQLLGPAPASDLYLATTPLTPASLALLDEDTHLLVPYEQVQATSNLAEDLAVGHARRRIVPDRAEVPQRPGTVADPRIAQILADPPVEAGWAIAEQRLVAETALMHLTRPGEDRRSLLVLPPVQWDPRRATAPAMLAGLLNSPWLDLGPPRPADVAPPAPLATRSAVIPGTVTAELTSAREQLDALRAAMPDGLPELDGQTVADLDDALLRALTPESLADAGAESLARITAVRGVADDAFGQVTLPEEAGVTLTSDTGQVPITLTRTEGGDIDLLVEVTSGAGLVWEDGGRRQRITLPEGASRTVAFSARAAARGTFQVTVSVWDPTRRKLLDSADVAVRSTAISQPALIIIGGVVLVLLAVGARRRRSPTLEVVR